MSAGGKGAGMGAVLAAHRLTTPVQCLCGWREDSTDSHEEHVAAALEAAGYGDLAQAWDEGHRDACPDHGDIQIGHPDRNPYRARAEQQAHSGEESR